MPGPRRRLVFAGLSHDTAALVFEESDFVDTLDVAILTHTCGGGVFKAALTDLPSQNIDGLESAI